MSRFSYIKYDEHSVAKQENLKKMYEGIEEYVNKNLGPSRAQSLILTKLEESYMWTGKAIRDEQIARTPTTNHEPGRSNQ